MPGSANLKNHFSKSVSSFAETSGREEKHKLTIQSPVVCPAPPHLGRIFVKTRKQISTSDIINVNVNVNVNVKHTLCKLCCW